MFLGFPGGSDGKESACNSGDLGLIRGSGRSPGGGHGNPLQSSCLENPHGLKKQESYRKTSTSALLTMPKPLKQGQESPGKFGGSGWGGLSLDACLERLLVLMAHFYVPVGTWCVVSQTLSARDIRDRKDSAGA